MSENEAPQGNPAYSPSEEIRYDLNGDPIPSSPRSGGAPSPPSPPSYAAPPSTAPSYGAPQPPPQPGYGAPPPASGYGAPQQPIGQSPYSPAPPPGQYGYGAPGQPAYGPGAPSYGAPRQGNKAGWIVAGIFGVLVVAGVAMFAAASKPQIVPVPTAFKSVKSGDGTFSVSGPADWVIQSTGETGSQGGSSVSFTKGAVSMEFYTNDAYASMSDGMRAGPSNGSGGSIDLGFGMPSISVRPAVEKMHIVLKDETANNYKDYREQGMQTLPTSFGDARVSEFTAKGGMFQGTIHGFRATTIAPGKCVTMDCHCPESNWDTMKPAFLKVMESVVSENG